MTTTYRGMYRLDSSANPSHIQVASPGGHSTPLPIELYEARGVLPHWNELPTEKQYKVLLAVKGVPQGSSAFVNTADAEECVDRGWLESEGINSWRLTEVGEIFL